MNAFNGTTGSSGDHTVVKYGTNVTSSTEHGFPVSSSGIHGVSASIGSTGFKITLTSTERSKLSNDITLTNVAGSMYATNITFLSGSDRNLIEVNRGYYNKEFVFKDIGDIETLYQNEVDVTALLSASSTSPTGSHAYSSTDNL